MPKTSSSPSRSSQPINPVRSISGPHVRALFDDIASDYDRFNQWASLGLDGWWRRFLVSRIPQGAKVLDIATGTGDVALKAAQGGHEVYGIDFSEPMLCGARAKDRRGLVKWIHASADHLDFPDRNFGAVTSAFALRNFRSCLAQVLSENFRLLAPGGKVLHMDFGRPSGPLRWGHQLYLRYAIPFIGRRVCGAHWPDDYLSNTIEEFYEPNEMTQLLQTAGFQNIQPHALLGGVVRLYEGTKPS